METEILSLATANNILVFAAGAFVIPILCAPLKIPSALGEIIYGILVGPELLGLTQDDDFTKLLSQVGFFLLMFTAGLELNFRSIERAGIRTLLRLTATVFGTFAASWLIVYYLQLPLFATVVMAAISIGLPIAILSDANLIKTKFGQYTLLVASIGEFVCIVLATFLASWKNSGGLNLQFAASLIWLVLVLVFAYVVLVLLRTAVWWKPRLFTRVVVDRDPSEVGVRAGIALMFMMVSVSIFFHIDAILGAFMAGALFSFVFRSRGPLENKFYGLANGFFVPVFFINVGAEFDLNLAWHSDLAVFAQLALGLFAARYLAILSLSQTPQRLTSSLGTALVLSAPLSILVVFGNMGVSLKLIDPAFNATILLVAIVTSLVYPIIFKMLLRWILPNPTAS